MSTPHSQMVQKKVKCMHVYLSIYLFVKRETNNVNMLKCYY